MQNREIGHVISHTHWDREWRYPVWQSRMQLIQLFDNLFMLFTTDPDFKAFLLDGQVIPVLDYLAMKPENKNKIITYIKEGRLQIGPWYTLPDEFPVDGECLVRNLVWGVREGDKYGGAMRIGYTSFGWGQTAQLPQIYANFGVEVCLIGKRVSKKRAPDSEFMWESPDGTSLLTTRFGEHGRANFNFEVNLPVAFGQKYTGDNWQYRWETCGLPYHRADCEAWYNDYFRLDQPQQYYPELIRECVEKVWETTDETVMKSHRLLMDGSDFTEPQALVTKMIKDANRLFEDRYIVHDSLLEFVELMKCEINTAQLAKVEGELRDGPNTQCAANALANRMDIKKLNRKAQNDLIRMAEPLATMAWMLGAEYPRAFMDNAWEYLLLSHPHDSINGVVQNKIAEDTKHRLRQVVELANVISDYSMGEMLKRIDLSKADKEDSLVVIFNPYPYSRKEIIHLWVDTQKDICVNRFYLVDENGIKADIQYMGRYEDAIPLSEGNSRPWPVYVDRHEIFIDSGEIPACGFKVYKVVPVFQFNRLGIYWPDPKVNSGSEMYVDPNTIENKFLKVRVQSNGTFSITDKSTGRKFENLGYYTDTAEAGDMWDHFEPSHNKTFSSIGASARIWMEECGELSATLVSEIVMKLPVCLEKDTNLSKLYGKRSETERDLILRTYITLNCGERSVKLKTVVHNSVEDHILKVMFPTGIKAEHSAAAGHFYVDKRPVKPVKEHENGYYPDMQTLPMQTFIDVSDGTCGLAIISKDIAEYEVMDNTERTVALTLLKATGTVVCTEFRSAAKYLNDKGCQMIGEIELEYGIYLHEGNYLEGKVYEVAQRFNTPLKAVQTGYHEGNVSSGTSLISLEGDFVMSTLKQSEDKNSVIVRLFNQRNQGAGGCIRSLLPIKSAKKVTMEEVDIESLSLIGTQEIDIYAARWEIVTIKIDFDI